MTTLATTLGQTAGTFSGPPDVPVYAVVGFDGSASSLRALDAAARLLHDRPGGMEIVYVAHISAVAAADVGGEAAAGVRQSFDDATRELSAEVRTRLQASHLRGAAQRWHFQRRDGAIADELIAVADDVRRQRARNVGGHRRRPLGARVSPRPGFGPAGPGAARPFPGARHPVKNGTALRRCRWV